MKKADDGVVLERRGVKLRHKKPKGKDCSIRLAKEHTKDKPCNARTLIRAKRVANLK